jgi:hypothetical protein
MQFWRSFRPHELDGLGELPVLKRIVKRHSLGARLGKDRAKPPCESLVRHLVGPQPEGVPSEDYTLPYRWMSLALCITANSAADVRDGSMLLKKSS